MNDRISAWRVQATCESRHRRLKMRICSGGIVHIPGIDWIWGDVSTRTKLLSIEIFEWIRGLLPNSPRSRRKWKWCQCVCWKLFDRKVLLEIIFGHPTTWPAVSNDRTLVVVDVPSWVIFDILQETVLAFVHWKNRLNSQGNDARNQKKNDWKLDMNERVLKKLLMTIHSHTFGNRNSYKLLQVIPFWSKFLSEVPHAICWILQSTIERPGHDHEIDESDCNDTLLIHQTIWLNWVGWIWTTLFFLCSSWHFESIPFYYSESSFGDDKKLNRRSGPDISLKIKWKFEVYLEERHSRSKE
jgi:hypothetical protein